VARSSAAGSPGGPHIFARRRERIASTRTAIRIIVIIGVLSALGGAVSVWFDTPPWPVSTAISFGLLVLALLLVWALASVERHLDTVAHVIGFAGQIYDSTNDGVVITAPDGTILDVNDAYCRIHGYPREQVLGKNPRMLKSGRHSAEFYREMWRAITEDGYWEGEVWDRRADDRLIVKWLSIAAIRDARGVTTEYAGIFTDLTQVRESEEKSDWFATHDPLTGLPNRKLLRNQFDSLIAHAQRHEGEVAVMILDLDRFSDVNNEYGFVHGDEVLLETSRRCRATLREEDLIARVGGDEFLIVLVDVTAAEDVEAVAERLLGAIAEPVTVNGRTAHVTASIGVTVASGQADPAQLARSAQEALARAKACNGDRYEHFSPEMQAESARRHEVERELRSALAGEGLHLVYQPQVDLRSGAIAGLEALIRLTTPDGRSISPGEIIPVAERTGLAPAVGAWVLARACDDLVALRERGYAGTVSVNFSAHEFSESGLADAVLAAVDSRGLPPQSLEVEITESAMMYEAGTAEANIERLRGHGFGIALDDFGTGYASVSYIQRFRPTTIKVDRSFVQDLPREPSAVAIVRATILLAEGVNAHVVAEGPETEEQVRFLLMSGYTYAQGYFFSKPVPLDEVFALLDRGPFELPVV